MFIVKWCCLGASSLTRQIKRRSDCMQRWIGFSEDEGRGFAEGANMRQLSRIDCYRVEDNAIHLARKLRPFTVRAMPLLDKLERRFGFLAIPGLIRIVIVFTALVWGLMRLNPNFGSALDLDPARISHGEVWRLVSFHSAWHRHFRRHAASVGAVFPLVSLVYWGGTQQAWGVFRLTLYFIVGMIGTTVAAVFLRARFRTPCTRLFRFRAILSRSGHLSFYLAAKIEVDSIGLGSILVVRLCCRHEFLSDGVGSCPGEYLIFFGPEMIHDARHRGEVSSRRKRYAQSARSEAEPLHKCAVCGATDGAIRTSTSAWHAMARSMHGAFAKNGNARALDFVAASLCRGVNRCRARHGDAAPWLGRLLDHEFLGTKLTAMTDQRTRGWFQKRGGIACICFTGSSMASGNC